MLIFIILIFVLVYMALESRVRKQRKQEFITLEFLTCIKCGYNVEKNFEPGDFIGLIKGKCPKCGGDLKVKGIYAVEKDKVLKPLYQ